MYMFLTFIAWWQKECVSPLYNRTGSKTSSYWLTYLLVISDNHLRESSPVAVQFQIEVASTYKEIELVGALSPVKHIGLETELVSWCFEPSQAYRVRDWVSWCFEPSQAYRVRDWVSWCFEPSQAYRVRDWVSWCFEPSQAYRLEIELVDALSPVKHIGLETELIS